jgi:hypothetical protein
MQNPGNDAPAANARESGGVGRAGDRVSLHEGIERIRSSFHLTTTARPNGKRRRL